MSFFPKKVEYPFKNVQCTASRGLSITYYNVAYKVCHLFNMQRRYYFSK